MQCNQAHTYAQENHILIPILKCSSVFIVLGVRLTKCQQIHSDIPLAALVYILIGTPIEPIDSFLVLGYEHIVTQSKNIVDLVY